MQAETWTIDVNNISKQRENSNQDIIQSKQRKWPLILNYPTKVSGSFDNHGWHTSTWKERRMGLDGTFRGERYCDCGKSMTSYPHWPPTCQSEAVDQLHCLVGQSYAHTWMAFLLGKATDGTKDDIEIISLVRNSCPVLLQSENNDTPNRKRGKFDCEGICRPVLEANSSDCLCACPCHREECPVTGAPLSLDSEWSTRWSRETDDRIPDGLSDTATASTNMEGKVNKVLGGRHKLFL